MPRIDIELTSARPDGTWTWRAAGARQPKGSLVGSLLHEGASVGDVVKADVEVDVDGMTVTTVFPPKAKKVAAGRLEILGPPTKPREDVTVERVTRGPGDGRDGDRPRGRDRGDRGERGDRTDRGGGRPATAREPRRERERERDRPGSGPGRPARPMGTDRPAARTRPPRERTGGPAGAPAASAPPPKPRPKRLHAGRTHRNAALASLPPEEQVIAEQVLRGGVPAVRQALDEQNAAARAAGQPEVRTDALIGIAERLVPLLRAAEWRDRAEAAVEQADELALRDLRALVVGSDAATRDEASRELAARLRQTLDERSAREREAWLAEITSALDEGRVVRALRSSSRPPEAGVRFPADLAERLSTAASDAMGSDAAADRWAAVLEAVTASPVRRLVKPKGLPSEMPDDFLKVVRQSVEKVPGLGPLVGAPPPPPIGARRPAPPPPPPPPPEASTAPVAP
jgi:hypothetical protein